MLFYFKTKDPVSNATDFTRAVLRLVWLFDGIVQLIRDLRLGLPYFSSLRVIA